MNTKQTSLAIGSSALVFVELFLLTSLLLANASFSDTITIIFVVLWLIVPSLLANHLDNHVKKNDYALSKHPCKKVDKTIAWQT